ncbi:MAG: molybdopterin-dependent oxidoreductase [Myxococcales bacterium]|nr:molybdopterin-dependent oxidoreductase [Myxococcales bacterium]
MKKDPTSTASTNQPPRTANPGFSRRHFLWTLAAGGASSVALASNALSAAQLLRAVSVENPLSGYPNRDWEKVYRNLYKHDSTFTFLCAPNDTHNCLLNAHVKNGVVTRISPTYGYGKATDLDGNKASHRWDPRCCQKGLALVRRFYGDRRIQRPLARRGFVDWMKAGMPRNEETGVIDPKYLMRGQDPWVPITWDEAFELSAKAIHNIAQTYTGEAGRAKLLAQGYDPLMVEATMGAGTQVVKFRGGMPALGMTRVFAQYRLANSMALLDDKLRGTGPDGSVGARGWDNYSWHTDLPPGHPMVTGQQTLDFDLCNAEHANLVLAWGMNWITTKMPDSHWLTEARMKGSRVVVITTEYSATANKGDEVLIVRPGTTPALALGMAQVVMSEKLYDADAVRFGTDLPLLVRMDTGKLLRATEIFDGYVSPLLTRTTVTTPEDKPLPAYAQAAPTVSAAQRQQWGDAVIWDNTSGKPLAVHPDQVGKYLKELNVDPALDGERTVTLTDGTTVLCRTVFDVTFEVLRNSYTPEDTEKLTWAPADAVRSIARQIAQNPSKTLFVMGMGPNQYFNSDLKDRAVFLLAALTANVGKIGGNVGSYAGNYRASYFNGLPQYINEDPFNPQLEPDQPATVRPYFKAESVHYFNHGDTILRSGNAVLTGKTHMPTPTKSICVSNSNSLIGNAKGHYETVMNVLPRVEFVGVNEWWWTASCEYADVVFPVDSWAEFKYPDLTISVTNPFLYVFPVTPLPRIGDTRSDIEVAAGIGRAIGKVTGDDRHNAYWKFIEEGTARPYIQRILDYSNATRGYRIDDLEKSAASGIPAILLTRTYPKVGGWEQGNEDKPWYTKTGRLEFYREEPEFMDAGENLVLHRETIDSTFYEPAVLIAKPHPLLKPKQPQDYGADPADQSADARQARHVIKTVDELLATQHPLRKDGFQFIFHTPKYRHGAHTTPVDTDIVAVWFGPFGDMHRKDKRMPFVSEAYVDIHPDDAKSIGVEDGDYVYIDADPHDRPFKGWEKRPDAYKVSRLLCRARYYPGTPRGVTRMWHNMYGATWESIRGQESSATGLAKGPQTGYQALFRGGSHQSCTRGWLKPTWMTDSLVVKGLLGQKITQGFVPDVHCPTGAPRDAFVKITKAESGGIEGKGLWGPAEAGLRPTYESESLKRFIAGGFNVKS